MFHGAWTQSQSRSNDDAAEAAVRACWSGSLNFPCRYLAVEAAIRACCSGSFALPLRYFTFEAAIRAWWSGSFALPLRYFAVEAAIRACCWGLLSLALPISMISSSSSELLIVFCTHHERRSYPTQWKLQAWKSDFSELAGNEEHFYAALPALTWRTWSTGTNTVPWCMVRAKTYKHRRYDGAWCVPKLCKTVQRAENVRSLVCSTTRREKREIFGNIETKGAIINSTPILIFSATMRTSLPSLAKVRILARESVNSSPILARQWWRHFRLCLSLSVCISLSHRKYLTHNIGSASALPIIGGMDEGMGLLLPILLGSCTAYLTYTVEADLLAAENESVNVLHWL